MSWEERSERLEREGPSLLWNQIADDIRAEINSGALVQSSRLPSEAELAEI